MIVRDIRVGRVGHLAIALLGVALAGALALTFAFGASQSAAPRDQKTADRSSHRIVVHLDSDDPPR